jgi:hypothetical protein
MSDWFEMLVDADVSLDEAPAVRSTVVERFRKEGLIQGRETKECVLGGKGYHPGPQFRKIYALYPGELPFWTLVVCGVEVTVGRQFNVWALGECHEGFQCPKCGQSIDRDNEAFDAAFGDALTRWDRGRDGTTVACPACAKRVRLDRWKCKPPLAFGNLAITFWNWPQLDRPSWKYSLPELVRNVTGHQVIHTYGHL